MAGVFSSGRAEEGGTKWGFDFKNSWRPSSQNILRRKGKAHTKTNSKFKKTHDWLVWEKNGEVTTNLYVGRIGGERRWRNENNINIKAYVERVPLDLQRCRFIVTLMREWRNIRIHVIRTGRLCFEFLPNVLTSERERELVNPESQTQQWDSCCSDRTDCWLINQTLRDLFDHRTWRLELEPRSRSTCQL